MANDYRTLLAQPAEEAIRTSGPLPVGHYIGTLAAMERGNAKSGTDRLRWPATLAEPCDDVSAEDLTGITVEGRTINCDYYLTPLSIGRLGKMVNGVLGSKPGVNMDERLPELRGQRVMIHLGHRQSDTSEDVFNEVISVVAAP